MLSRVSFLTDADIFFVSKSVQAGCVLSTWVTEAWILMIKEICLLKLNGKNVFQASIVSLLSLFIRLFGRFIGYLVR